MNPGSHAVTSGDTGGGPRLLKRLPSSIQDKAAKNEQKELDKKRGKLKKALTAYMREDELVPSEYENKPAALTEFIYTPITIERMIIFGLLVCADSLLFVFTVLPLRACVTLYYFARGWQTTNIMRVDVFKMILIVVGYCAVRSFHFPQFLDLIEQESLFKLKVLLKVMLPLMDLLLGSLGLNILAGLWWTLGEPSHWLKWNRGFVWHFGLSVIYVIGHSALLLFYIVVYDVLINSDRITMISLLALVQFTEMKGAVVKEIKEDKLLNMCQKDVLERFTLAIFLVLLFFYNVNVKHTNDAWDREWVVPLFVDVAIIYFSEIAVDWVKHASIVNYNAIGPHVYTKFVLQFNKKVDPKGSRFMDNRCHKLASDFGLMPITFAIVVLKIMIDFIRPEIHTTSDMVIGSVAVYLVLLLLRFINGYCLSSYVSQFEKFEPHFERANTRGKLYMFVDEAQEEKHMAKQERKRKKREEQAKEAAELEREDVMRRGDSFVFDEDELRDELEELARQAASVDPSPSKGSNSRGGSTRGSPGGQAAAAKNAVPSSPLARSPAGSLRRGPQQQPATADTKAQPAEAKKSQPQAKPASPKHVTLVSPATQKAKEASADVSTDTGRSKSQRRRARKAAHQID